MAGCQFAGCDADDLLDVVHFPTDTVRTYCPDHAPNLDGELWGRPDD